MSVASDSSTDNAALIREMHGHTAPAPGISSTSLQTVHLSTQFQSQSSRPFMRMLSPLLISALSDLLDQDSEMQRAMGVADSFDGASTHQAPSCRFPHSPRKSLFTLRSSVPQMAEPSLAARSRSSLVRAGSLTETKLTTNALRQSEGSQAQRRRYDSLERPSKLANGVVDPPVASSNASSVMGPGEFSPETLVYALSYVIRSVKHSKYPSTGTSG